MNCNECGAWISVDDHLDYEGLCPYCHEVKEWKWFCENCDHEFDKPKWVCFSLDETPLCPKCESINIDLTTSRDKHKKRTAK